MGAAGIASWRSSARLSGWKSVPKGLICTSNFVACIFLPMVCAKQDPRLTTLEEWLMGKGEAGMGKSIDQRMGEVTN
jgi:hypothetical protein